MDHPSLLGLATVEAPFPAPQDEVREQTMSMFAGADFATDELAAVFDNAGIERRTLAWPLKRYALRPGIAERTARFSELAPSMLRDAALQAADAGLRERVTHVVTVCSSGIATPTLECLIADDIGVPASARRVPVFGLGCGGGAAGLAVARDLARSAEGGCVLLLVVELTSLTLMTEDVSRRNFVACALFGDGAAAAVIGSATPEYPALATIEKAVTRRIPDSLDLMGWQVEPSGWRVVFSPRIPAVVKREVSALVDHVMDGECAAVFVLHPGGARILDAYKEALGISEDDVATSTAVLREHGNMSAVTVLFVLARMLESPRVPMGKGVVTAFGPGFSAEALRISFGAG